MTQKPEKPNIWMMNHYAGHQYFDKGGRHYYFAKYLKRDGYNPVIFCSNATHFTKGYFYDTDALAHRHLAKEIDTPFVFVKSRAYEGNGKQRILNMMDFYFNVKRAAKTYAKQHGKPDIILASSVHPLTLVAGLQLAKRFRVPCICEIRDLWPESIVAYGVLKATHPAVLMLRALEKWVYKKADTLIFTCEGARDYLKDQGWENIIPEEKIFYINNGVDLEQFDSNRERYKLDDPDLMDDSRIKVIYTGSVRRVNNIGILLDAAKLMNDDKAVFLIYGDGDELDELRGRIRAEDIENVIFKGRVNKKYIPYILSCADVQLLHWAQTPIMDYWMSANKIFDYLAAGKPICSDIKSKYNPVLQYKAGIEVDGFTAGDIANTVKKLLEIDEEEKNEYKANARRAAEQYDVNTQVKQLEMICDRERIRRSA